MIKKKIVAKKMVEIVEDVVGITKKKDVAKIEAHFTNNERKFQFALLVFNSTGWDDIKEDVEALNYVRTHTWEMRNELSNILDRPLPCPNC